MPGVHRDLDARFCKDLTDAKGQTTVFVEGKLVAVEGDQIVGGGAPLKAVYGGGTIFINGKKVIVAVGDKSLPSRDSKKHAIPPTSPKGHSQTVILYGGGAGGGT
jgi:hypothetical protein